ncbi:MAG TPA: APC family permease [Gemmatimonadaceae bacterium]|nr:APC family permease [Gemmatimonadaceae bacterium]
MTTPQAAESADLSKFGYDAELRRSLSLGDLLVYGLVFIVPTAPFAIFGIVFNASKGMVALTYLIGLIAMVFTALSYRAMSEAFPVAGSVYAYAGRGLHPSAGFLAGWAILLDYLLVPTLCYVVGAVAMHAVVPSVPQPLWIIGFLVFNTVINMLGIETTARASKIFLAGELIVLALFVLLGAVAVSRGVNGSHWTLKPFFNPAEFHFNIIFSALSVAVLSFLGFDAISTLAEEAKGGTRVVGQATMIALCIAAILFIIQTYIAALLVPDRTTFAGEAAMNDAFYTISAIVGGSAFKVIVAVSAALSAAIANALVAQAATARLLFAMARDGQLPRFLAHVHPTRRVPERAILFVATVSLILGLFFVGQVGLVSSLVNFGALFSFLMLHVSVVVYFLIRRRSRAFGVHLLSPVIGFAIIAFVLVNADVHAKVGGLVWLAIGAMVLIGLRLRGRSAASLPMSLSS